MFLASKEGLSACKGAKVCRLLEYGLEPIIRLYCCVPMVFNYGN